jgi:hypothetical protein
MGSWMGLIFAMGAIPRAVGPFYAVWALCLPQLGQEEPLKYNSTICHRPDDDPPHTYIEFGVVAVLFASALLMAALVYSRLTPHPEIQKEMEVRKGGGKRGDGTGGSVWQNVVSVLIVWNE